MFFGSNSPTASVLSMESRQHGEDVKIVSLDNYFHADYFKHEIVMLIDVEGYEPKVLAGAFRIINKYQPIIFFRVQFRLSEALPYFGDHKYSRRILHNL